MTTYNAAPETDPLDFEFRREHFMRQEWRCKPETGNYILHYNGQWITLVRSKFGSGWGVYCDNIRCWKYNGERINDLENAKAVAFEMLENANSNAPDNTEREEEPCQS